jgi:MoaA/NifB/PqqE/SkfB family radical SAM enzyme
MTILNYAVPPILQLEPTTACNLGCPFCLRSSLSRSDEYLSFDAFCQIIDRTKCRYLTLHGWGEPLMNPALGEMIRYASGHGKSVNFTTNASLIDTSMEDDILSSGLAAIAFSLPDSRRCTPDIAGNISRFVERKRAMGMARPRTYVNIALMEENLDQVDGMLRIAEGFGVDTVVFERSFPWTRDLSLREKPVFGKIKKTAAQLGCEVKLPPTHSMPCPLIKYTLFVRWNGDVAPCCYRADTAIANVFLDGPVGIIRKRAEFMKKMATDPVCRKCLV